MTIAILISFLVFVSIILLIAGAYFYYQERKRSHEFVEKIRGSEEKLAIAKENEFGEQKNEGHIMQFHSLISSLGARFKPDNEEISGMRLRLVQAGFRGYNTPVVFFGYRVFFAVLLPVILLFGKVFLIKSISPGAFLVILCFFALVGFYLPNFWLNHKISSRQQNILDGFPDALDLMVVCVESGMGLDSAINRVGEEMKLRNRDLSEEFVVLGLELRAGKLRKDALRNLGIRTGLDDVKSLMTLLIQTDKFGTSIAQALRVHSDSMRTRRYQRAEEMAAKLPVKLVFPLILFIFPALFVVIIGPAAIKIIRTLLPAMGGQ
jgi:tight adherence protein C